jgi:hypothetical protein
MQDRKAAPKFKTPAELQKTFTPEDGLRATAYADREAGKFTKAWHLARNGYLIGLAEGRTQIRETDSILGSMNIRAAGREPGNV